MFCKKPENVAEHSHQVAIVAHLLAVIKNKTLIPLLMITEYQSSLHTIKQVKHVTGILLAQKNMLMLKLLVNLKNQF